jgi:kynurenine formamidase
MSDCNSYEEKMKIIDLTYPISENMPMYPGTDAPTLHVAYSHKDYGFMETLISLYSHTGTHIDAPAHLFADGLTLDQYPVKQFVGKALVIDCRKLKKGERISMSLLEGKENALQEAEFILFLTGHSAFWGSPDYFDNFPVMSQEVVEWVNRRKLKGIGIDAPSFDPIATDGELHNHQAILKTNNTVLLENLCKLEEIGDNPFTLCALPLNTVNADGAPARIIAMG